MNENALIDHASGAPVETQEVIEADIRGSFENGKNAIQEVADCARSIGEGLKALKDLCAHGEWSAYLEKAYEERRIPFQERQAQKYLRIFKQWDFVNLKLTSDLTVDQLDALCAPEKPPTADLGGDTTPPVETIKAAIPPPNGIDNTVVADTDAEAQYDIIFKKVVSLFDNRTAWKRTENNAALLASVRANLGALERG